VAEAAHIQQKPFADSTAGMEYFASEAHYRLLAANIREQLQQHGGCVLLTGNPAPNSDLLLRQLTVVGTPRCRATAIKCHAQMSAAGLMDSYRRLVGSTIEAVTRRVVSWSTQGGMTTRGQEVDILVLDNAESLDDEVLRQLCSPPEDAQERWPPRLLVADESLVERLAAHSLDAVSSTIDARFSLHRLVQREVGSFIRYQLTAADLDQLDIFKPQVIELIEIYADGDPVIVNGLARRILRIVPELAARRLEVRNEEEGEKREPDAAPPAVMTPAALEQTPPLEVAQPPLSPLSDMAPADAVVVSAPPESAPPAADSPTIPPLALVPDARTESAPAEDEPPIAQMVEAVSPLEPAALAKKAAAPEEPSVAVEAAALSATVLPPLPSWEQPSVPLAAELAIVQPVELASSPEAEAPLTELPPLDAVARPHIPSLAQESALAAAESPIATLVDTPVETVVEPDAAPTVSDDDREALATPPPRRRGREVAFSFALAAAVIAVAITVGATQRRDAEGTYLDAAVKFVGGSGLFAHATKMSSGLFGASAPVPKDLGTQRLRTTTDDANRNLLIAAEPTEERKTTGAKATESAAITNTNNTTRPPPPEPSRSVAAGPAAPAREAAAVPPPAATGAPPSAAAPVAPVKREAPAVAVSAPPAPAPSPPSVAAPIAPVTHEAPATPTRKEAAAPPANRTLSSADIGLLLRHGDQLLASGDIVAARHYFELVAEAGDLRAALRLGKTYDPAYLQQNGVRGIAGDSAVAKSWYLKAIASGDKEADLQLLRLMTLYPEAQLNR
jgi:type II secretory pathway predicted ATPase ExeA